MNYELIMSGLWIDYRWNMSGLKVMGGNPCVWTPFIMWSYLMLMYVTFFWQWFSELVFGSELNVPNFIGTFNNGVLTFQNVLGNLNFV
jgi:hypothetical protein